MVFSISNTIFTDMIKSTYNIIGVMSGTSLDGIDLAYITFEKKDNWKFKIHTAETVRYSIDWKTQLRELVHLSPQKLVAIDHLYSTYLAEVISSFINKHQLAAIDFVASHGHTALHQPANGSTYQIGNLQELADGLQRKVICDFRVQDVNYGGQGAPLVPIGDRLLFSEYDYCVNLGGFANISFENNAERIAFDICPVNIVLNNYVACRDLEYDDGGKLAASGGVNKTLLEELNALSFYKETPPKSLGLEWVQRTIFPLIDRYQLPLEDLLCTFTAHISNQISAVIKDSKAKVLMTGGGVYNHFLMDCIRKALPGQLEIPSDAIVEFKEALIFGFLGVLKDREEINCLKSVTGASKDHASGKILIPNN